MNKTMNLPQKKRTTKISSTFRLREGTRQTIKDIAEAKNESEAGVIEFLVDQYMMYQTIKHVDDEGYETWEFLPWYTFSDRVLSDPEYTIKKRPRRE